MTLSISSAELPEPIEVALLNIDGTSGFRELEVEVASVMREYLELWKKKQKSYGPGNIAKFGELGCLIRSTDKIERLRNMIYLNRKNPLADESVEDTWLDLMGYALMGLMCHRGRWPGVEANVS